MQRRLNKVARKPRELRRQKESHMFGFIMSYSFRYQPTAKGVPAPGTS
jgi:hypothetical protein